MFFDLAGTLINVRGGIGAQYAAIGREFGVEADPAALDAAFPIAFGSADSPRLQDPAEAASLEKGFWKEVVRLVFAQSGGLPLFPPGAFDRYFDRLFHYFETAAPWAIYPDVVPALAELRGRRLVLGLITNFDQRVFKLVDALGLNRLIDSITIPALAGAPKPEAAIFEYALARHGLQPREAVLVGDSLSDDVEGAHAAGMRGVLIDRKDVQRGAVSRVRSLQELPRLIGLAR